MNPMKSPRAVKLSPSITETEFDNGYWYADDLKKFGEKIGVPSARRLRKDELEQAVKHFLRTGDAKSFARRTLTKFGPRDVDLGLRLDLRLCITPATVRRRTLSSRRPRNWSRVLRESPERDTCSTVGGKNSFVRVIGLHTAIWSGMQSS
jgi:hypothetical protein